MKPVLLTFLAIIFAQQVYAQTTECSDVYSSLVFDQNTRDILQETRAEEIYYPASLTKLMTLYLTFEALSKKHLSLNEELTISEHGEEVAKVNKINTLKSKEGDKITVKEAIEAVVVKSFNEASVTLAEAVGGDEWNFARLMNKKAEELGMQNTSFHNASGLHEDGHYTTAYDLARLTHALIRDFPQYYHFFALKKFKYNKIEYESGNHILFDYKGADGLKTGFTKMAGFNLISSAKKDKARVISILMNCVSVRKRDDFTIELLDSGFKKIHNGPEYAIKLK